MYSLYTRALGFVYYYESSGNYLSLLSQIPRRFPNFRFLWREIRCHISQSLCT